MTGPRQAEALAGSLSDSLAKLESELDRDQSAERPRELAFIEAQVATLCGALTDLPTSERAAAREQLQRLTAQLGRIEQRVERHLAELSRRLGAGQAPTLGGGG